MKSKKTLILAAMVIIVAFMSTNTFAGDYTHSTPGINGYDPVAYFTDGKPVKGNGYHVADYEGVIYVFADKKNRKMFEANPEKYIPAYGGYCAYGVAVGKKFIADPEVWRIEKRSALSESGYWYPKKMVERYTRVYQKGKF